jgi:hypothetical protein
MPESSASPPPEDTSPVSDKGGYAPYGQLVKMLLPSARSIAIYDSAGELVWCSDGYERPELRKLLDELRASDTVAGRGRVENTVDSTTIRAAATAARCSRASCVRCSTASRTG